MNECVDLLADKLYNGGKIKDKCENAGFYERLILLEKQFKGVSVLHHKQGFLPVGFRNLWTNERLLNMVEQLIGPNIAGEIRESWAFDIPDSSLLQPAGHPVWNLRTKTPHNEQATVPWHQDNAYLDSSALHTFQPTAWIPLIDANMENGCMQVTARCWTLMFSVMLQNIQ